MEGVESIVRGDLNPGSHDIVEVLEQRGDVFGFGGRDHKQSRDARRDQAVEFPRRRARDNGERKLKGDENAKEIVGGDNEKTRGGAKECVGNKEE